MVFTHTSDGKREQMKYDFDKITPRYNTNSLKYDFAEEFGKPKDILPLWVADMDFPVAEEITAAMQKAVAFGIYGYSIPKDSYYDAVMKWMEQRHHWKTKKEWIVKTPGVVFAIANAIRALTKEGDAVIIQTPVYYPFGKMVQENNRTLIDSPLILNNGRYVMNLADFEEKIVAHSVKLFILCNPHNPVGRVWSKEELQAIGEICLKHGVYVVSDEIHHDFIYPGQEHFVFVNLDERFAQMTLTCTAPSKTFNLAGLQTSNIFIPNEELREAFSKELSKTGYDEINMLGLVACEAAYKHGSEWLEQLLVYLQGNLEYTKQYIQENIPKIHVIEPEGTYLLWLDCRELGLSAKELDELMVNKAGLWLDGGEMFGVSGEGFQRVNIACPRSVLEQALSKLKKAVETV